MENSELAQYLYEEFMKKEYPDGLITLDAEKDIFQRPPKWEKLTDVEKELFVFFSDTCQKFIKENFILTKQ